MYGIRLSEQKKQIQQYDAKVQNFKRYGLINLMHVNIRYFITSFSQNGGHYYYYYYYYYFKHG